MRTKKYADGGNVYTSPMPNTANSSQPPQSNVNMPLGQGSTGAQGQPQAQSQGPFNRYTSGITPDQRSMDINVGGDSMGQNDQTGMQKFRKGGYVKAADGIATKGKTRGRMC